MNIRLLSAFIALLTVFIMAPARHAVAQDWGIGLRLGTPSGLTIKKYLEGGNALELSVGRAHVFSGNHWYNNRFHDWYGNRKFGYRDVNYLGYRASTPIAVQIHYLFQKPINRIGDESVGGLDWYYGLGGQLRFQRFWYDYRYKVKDEPDWFYERDHQVTDIDAGIDGVLGLEYNFQDAPISLFADITLFMEVFDNPFLFWFQGGLGGRFRF